jgi:hypothetical protein
MAIRKIDRSPYEEARDVVRAIAQRQKEGRDVVCLKRILKLSQLRLRGPSGAHDEFLLAATAQNLRKMAKRLWIMAPDRDQWQSNQKRDRLTSRSRIAKRATCTCNELLPADFFNTIGHKRKLVMRYRMPASNL